MATPQRRKGLSQRKKQAMIKKIIGLVVAILIAVIGYYFAENSGESNSAKKGGLPSESVGWHIEGDQAFTPNYGFDTLDIAKKKLDELEVKPKNGAKYDRIGQFGVPWQYDFDNSGCRTRADILQRDLYETKLDHKNCEVLEGIVAYDPYTGRSDVKVTKDELKTQWDIEHIVALEDACWSGACEWKSTDKVRTNQGVAQDPFERRQQIANDPLNIITVDGPQNRSKQSATLDKWNVQLNGAWTCEYVQRQIDVKYKYNLSVKPAEKQAMQKQINTCNSKSQGGEK